MKIKRIGYTSLPIRIPRKVAVCPICDADLIIEDIDEWETETGKATEGGLHFSCSKEPEFDEDDCEDFGKGHYSMPYVDWLPLAPIVLNWFNKGYRIESGE